MNQEERLQKIEAYQAKQSLLGNNGIDFKIRDGDIYLEIPNINYDWSNTVCRVPGFVNIIPDSIFQNSEFTGKIKYISSNTIKQCPKLERIIVHDRESLEVLKEAGYNGTLVR